MFLFFFPLPGHDLFIQRHQHSSNYPPPTKQSVSSCDFGLQLHTKKKNIFAVSGIGHFYLLSLIIVFVFSFFLPFSFLSGNSVQMCHPLWFGCNLVGSLAVNMTCRAHSEEQTLANRKDVAENSGNYKGELQFTAFTFLIFLYGPKAQGNL